MTFTTDALAIDGATQRLLFTDARSSTRFAATPVPVEALRMAYDLVKWGPTGNNAMPLRVAVAESEGSRATVIAHATERNRVILDQAPLIVVVAADHDYHRLVDITAPGVAGLFDRLAAAPEARAANAHANTWLQMGYLIVGLRAAGLDVRPLGGFDKVGLTDALFAGSGWHAELIFAVGYPAPDSDHGAGERKGRPSWDDAARVL